MVIWSLSETRATVATPPPARISSAATIAADRPAKPPPMTTILPLPFSRAMFIANLFAISSATVSASDTQRGAPRTIAVSKPSWRQYDSGACCLPSTLPPWRSCREAPGFHKAKRNRRVADQHAELAATRRAALLGPPSVSHRAILPLPATVGLTLTPSQSQIGSAHEVHSY